MTPYRLVEHRQHFGGTCCPKLHFISTLKMEVTGSSKTMATFHQTASQKTVIFFRNVCCHQSTVIELRFSQQSQWRCMLTMIEIGRKFLGVFFFFSWKEGPCLKYAWPEAEESYDLWHLIWDDICVCCIPSMSSCGFQCNTANFLFQLSFLQQEVSSHVASL